MRAMDASVAPSELARSPRETGAPERRAVHFGNGRVLGFHGCSLSRALFSATAFAIPGFDDAATRAAQLSRFRTATVPREVGYFGTRNTPRIGARALSRGAAEATASSPSATLVMDHVRMSSVLPAPSSENLVRAAPGGSTRYDRKERAASVTAPSRRWFERCSAPTFLSTFLAPSSAR
jgi:hypothetical protein